MADSALGAGGYTTHEDKLISSEFNLFTKTKFYKDVSRIFPIIMRPQHAGGSHGVPYNFEAPFDLEKWSDLSSILLHGRTRVRNNTTKKAPVATENWSVVCNLFASLFSKVIVKINGTEISDPTSNPVPWKSYIENLLNYSKDYQQTVMISARWIPDIAKKDGHYLTEEDANAANKKSEFSQAYVDRRAGIATGSWIEFCIPLPSDIITATRYLPPGYTVSLSIF